jgi:hypothetical protein
MADSQKTQNVNLGDGGICPLESQRIVDVLKFISEEFGMAEILLDLEPKDIVIATSGLLRPTDFTHLNENMFPIKEVMGPLAE